MKNYTLFCLVVLLIKTTMSSADTIPGGDVSGTWYQANSPYYINGEITIPTDSKDIWGQVWTLDIYACHSF